MEQLNDKIKKNLIKMRNSIDIIKLTKTIFYLKDKLFKIYQKKREEKCLIEI